MKSPCIPVRNLYIYTLCHGLHYTNKHLCQKNPANKTYGSVTAAVHPQLTVIKARCVDAGKLGEQGDEQVQNVIQEVVEYVRGIL